MDDTDSEARYEETEADRDSEHALEVRWGFDSEPWEEPCTT